MSVTVLCQGCGGRVPVPEDYARARIRCPECGVMCDVPPAAQRQAAGGDKPRRAREEADAAAEDILLGNDPLPPAEDRPAPRKPAPRATEPLHPLPPSPNLDATDEDDGRPYRVPGLDEVRPCPQCHRDIPREAVLCTLCGYNLQTGKKAKQKFEPVDRQWQGGWPVKVRVAVFVVAEALFVTAAVISTTAGGLPLLGALCPCLLFMAMTAFLLGTYEHLHLTRDKKGRVRLTKTWSACFVPRPPQDVDVRDYGSVVYGPVDDTSIMEWLLLILLILAGIVPGVIWAYFVFVRPTFQVGLCKEYGYSDMVLYRGSNEQMVLDVADTVQNVAHLPLSKS